MAKFRFVFLEIIQVMEKFQLRWFEIEIATDENLLCDKAGNSINYC